MSQVKGMVELQANLKALEKSAGRHIVSAYIAGGKLVESDAKRAIQDKSSGHEVTRHREGGASYQHLASNPGGAPNTDTGALVNSIQTEVTSEGVFVGTTLEYGKFLEFGTSGMDERPWLMPALNGRADDIIKLQVNALNQAIAGAAKHV